MFDKEKKEVQEPRGKKKLTLKQIIIGSIIDIIIIFCVITCFFGGEDYDKKEIERQKYINETFGPNFMTVDASETAYKKAQEFIKQTMQLSDKAVFPSYDGYSSVRGSEQKYIIVSSYDVPDISGEMITMFYNVTIKQIEKDNWIIENYDVFR